MNTYIGSAVVGCHISIIETEGNFQHLSSQGVGLSDRYSLNLELIYQDFFDTIAMCVVKQLCCIRDSLHSKMLYVMITDLKCIEKLSLVPSKAFCLSTSN